MSGVPKGLWNVPQGTKHFTGRVAVLEELHRQLAVKEGVGLTQAIDGLGGVGKTTLATAYAKGYAADYHAILWFNASSVGTLEADFSALARVIKSENWDAKETQNVLAGVRTFLSAALNPSGEKPVLLIYDNVEAPADVHPFVPQTETCRCLFTSRLRDLDGLVEGSSLPLDVFSKEEAIDYFQGYPQLRPQVEAEPGEVEKLAQELGWLPLALEQVAAYLCDPDLKCSFADYRKEYEQVRLDLFRAKGPRYYDHKKTVATTWSISLARFHKEPVAELMRYAAFLAPDHIPIEIFLNNPDVFGPTLAAALANTEGREAALKRLLKPATGLSLLRYSPADAPQKAEQQTLSLHRLVQEIIREQITPEEQRAYAEQVVRALYEAYPGQDFAKWGQCERLLPHWRLSAEYIQSCGLTIVEAGSLLNQIGFYLVDRGQYAEAEPLYVRARAIRETQLGLEHPDTAQSLNNLAALYESQGRYEEAEPLYVRALEIMRQALGDQHPNTLTVRSNLEIFRRQHRVKPPQTPIPPRQNITQRRKRPSVES